MRRTLWSLGALLIGCGGASTAAPPPAPAAAERAEAIPSPPTPWAQMDRQARGQWMYAEVVPRMSERLHAFDEERFAEVSCATCHGPDAEARGFAMPSPALPPLPERGTPEADALHAAHPETIRFMSEEVVPTMRALLGVGEELTCHSCHPHAQ